MHTTLTIIVVDKNLLHNVRKQSIELLKNLSLQLI